MTSNCTWKRITSLLLVFLMVLGMAPVNAFAAEGAACGCESDDPSWHAPFCEAYVAPEAPQCQCVEQCAEGAANEWCDVCYFDAAACAASGEEEAAAYATAPTYISKIAVSYGVKESTPKDILRENGFTIIDYDLNKGCGATSHYIYLGYKTTTDPSQAITGIFFSTDKDKPNTATFDGVIANLLGGSGETNPGENKAVDLNSDAKGSYIYTYVTRDTSRAPLTEIVIDASSSKSGYVTPNVNLNQGTSGGSIYLHYKQFSATVKATYHYLNASGSRTSSTQSGTVKTHLEQMSKVPSYDTSVTYDGRAFTFKGWREDDTAAASNATPSVTYMNTPKTYRAVYSGTLTLSYNANGGSGAPANQTATQYINAGSSSISKETKSFTVSSTAPTHASKCAFLGWATGSSATSAAYTAGKSISISANTTLYAVWKDHADTNSDSLCDSCGQSLNQPSLSGGVYQISNKAQLIWFMQEVNRGNKNINGKLTANIDMSGYNWTPIAQTGLYYKTTTYNNPDAGYTGTFDGNGKVISNLKITTSTTVEQTYGLFGTLSGTVKNLGMSGVSYTFPSGKKDLRAGGIVGQMLPGSTVTDCYVVDSTIAPNEYIVGGIAACNYGGTIANCYTKNVTISGNTRCGNLVSDTSGDIGDRVSDRPGTVTNCYTDADRVVGTQTGNKVTGCEASVSAARFASGEVAYKLGAAWGQTIGSNAYPILGGQKVYCGYTDCQATVKTYANTPLAENVGVHSYDEKGFCTLCEGYQPATGDGTQDNPYKIGNAGQLYWFAAVVNAGYGDAAQNVAAWAELTANITVNADVLKEDGTLNGDGSGFLPWTPIGDNHSSISRYSGTFNGNGKTVSGLYFNGNTSNVGLFGWSLGTVKNVGVVDSYLSGSASYVGGVVGRNDKGTITDCYNEGTVSGYRYVGGVVGSNSGTVEDCYNTGTVSGSDYYVGGVVGYNIQGTVVNCYNTSTVSGSKDYVGGVMGYNNGTVEDCYNTGTVSGSDRYVGGVVGINRSTVKDCYNTGTVSGTNDSVGGVVGINSGTVVNSYSSGSVSGSVSWYVGGVVGQNDGTVTKCYNEGTVSGYRYVGGVVGNNIYGAVESCYNSGSVSGSGSWYVGGVVGYNNSSCIVANCYNAGTVSSDYSVGGVAGLNDGTVVNCYYNSTVCSKSGIGENTGAVTDVLGKTTAEFASGAVTYSLSQGCTVGEGEAAVTYTGDVWGQNIDGTGDKDTYPVFSDAKVYRVKNCNGDDAGYSNTDGKQLDHTYENGFCTVCDGFQSAIGDGTESNPYQIGNAGQLYWFAAEVNGGDTDAWAELTADITVNKNVLKEDGTLNGDGSGFRAWIPIGYDYSAVFKGVFDGKDFSISGLYFNNSAADYVGLFGYINDGTIQNVGVVDSYFSGDYGVGGVVGYHFGGDVTNCYNAGFVNGGSSVGGVIGESVDVSVTNCYNTGFVNGDSSVGGVAGSKTANNLRNCYNTGTVIGNQKVGGVVGYDQQTGSVCNCYNTGSVSGDSNVGGLVGYGWGSNRVVNSYNIGSVSGNSNVGGLVGQQSGTNSYVANSYYDTTRYSGDAIGSNSGTAVDVMGKTPADFASGQVAYLLNRSYKVVNTTYSGDVWGQNLDGEGEKDAYPLFSDAKVYPAKNCDGSDGAYSNTQGMQKDHIYSENGFCANFGCYQPATGSGTESDPYKIGNAGQLYWFAKQVNSGNKAINGKLTANIVVNENVLKKDGTLSDDSGDFRVWTPIGNNSNNYTGTFNGNGNTVSGLYINENTNYVGLFGSVAFGTVKNVGVLDSYISGQNFVGGVVGFSNRATVENCYNTGAVRCTNNQGKAGGVVGSDSIGSIKNCYNTGAVSGTGFLGKVGGVVGFVGGTTVENCYNTGAVSGTGLQGNVGGVSGFANGSGTIKNCYNRGTVISTGSEAVAGGVLGNTDVQTVTVENCYYDSTVYNGDAIGGTFGGTATNVEGKTTEQFKSGEVAFLLQGEQTQQVWGQNIDGEGEKDAYPLFSNAKVYPAKNCNGSDGIYSNTQDVQKDHAYENGFCANFGCYQPATGSGTESDPYKIGNAGQLYWFAAEVNDGDTDAWAVLTANITVNTGDVAGCNGTKAEGWKEWTPIGKDYDTQYTGTFDGKGFTVSGLYFNENTDDVGLFGCSSGTVKNVGVVDSYLHGRDCVSGVVGYNYFGNMEDCYNTGTVIGSYQVGGVTSCNIRGTVTNCYNEGSVSSSGSYVGGVVGLNDGNLESCYNSGTVSGSSGNYVGGVAGYNGGTVTNCYNEGSIIDGTWYVGGVAGSNYGTVANCYNTGNVSGEIFVGGVAGTNFGSVVNCYYDSIVYSGNAIGENTGAATDVLGKTTADFASGAVTYSLSQGCTVGETVYSGKIWGQNLDGEGKKDACPVFSNAKVYPAKNCDGSEGIYSNTQDVQKDHIYSENGFCTVCKGYQPATGDGTQDNPYQIGNAGQLYWFAAKVNDGDTDAWAELTANIVVNENVLKADGTLNTGTFLEWTPMGNVTKKYEGTFDGKGKTVSGLYFNNSTMGYVGLFGYVSYGTIKNVGVVDSYFRGNDYVSGVAGRNNLGTVESCYNTGIVSGSKYVGGVVGKNTGTITDCYNKGAVSGNNDYVGGLVGDNTGTVVNCYNTGTVSRSGNNVGGVVGYNTGTVENCYNTGTVSGSNYVGGVVGRNNTGPVENCYNTGTVSGSGSNVGGVVGINYSTVANSYNTGSVSGDEDVGGLVGINSKGTVVNSYNTGTVSSNDCDGGVVGCNTGTVVNCYYDRSIYNGNAIGEDGGTATNVAGKITADFASGAVTYSLSQGCTATVPDGRDENFELIYVEKNFSGEIWGQNIDGEGEKDAYPVFSNAKVYPAKNCDGSDGAYSNAQDVQKDHIYSENGFCAVCDAYEPAVWNNTELLYEISNAGQLYWFAQQVNGGKTAIDGKLMADIVVNENVLKADGTPNDGPFLDWTPIGNTFALSYSGIFDGNNKTISGLYYNSNQTNVGLFGVLGGTVQNVGLVDSYFSGSQYVGGIAGTANPSSISNCYNTGSISGKYYVGGIVGYGTENHISNCYNTGSISGKSNVGSVAGYTYSSNISNCYYLADAETDELDGTSAMTAMQFASGQVAYLLSQGCTVGETVYSGKIWGQNIDGAGDKDAYPVFSDAKVYAAKNCANVIAGYSNTDGKQLDHTYNNNGFCTVCDGYEPATGSGTSESPYQIGNAGQLYWFAAEVNGGDTDAWAVLTTNITVNTGDVAGCNGTKAEGWKDWTPIGKNYDTQYAGTFDGKEFTVSGLYFDNSTASYVGLFGCSKGTVKNVGVVDSYISGGFEVGGVAGNNYGTVANCYNTGAVSGRNNVGGVVGKNYEGTVESCYNTGNVSGEWYVGGVAGENRDTVANCYNTGTVSGSYYTGGVVSRNYGTVANCYNTGSVSGSSECVGGVAGQNSGAVANCYNTGSVRGSSSECVGGVVGKNISNCTVVNSYNTGSVSVSGSGSGSQYVGGVVGHNYMGIVVNCYYNSEIYIGNASGFGKVTATDVPGKTTADFASGEVAYSLSQGCTVGETVYSGKIWGQNIDGEGEKDAYPVFSDAKVYRVKNCKGETAGYSNTDGKQLDHTYANGFCTVCGKECEHSYANGFCTVCGKECEHSYANGFCTVCGRYEAAVYDAEEEVYCISNAGQLYWFAQLVNQGIDGVERNYQADAVLTENITVNTNVDGTLQDGEFKDWILIGVGGYTGTFDGNNKTVSGLYYNNPNMSCVGFFAKNSGTVKNVTIADSYFCGSQHIGGVVGENDEGTVEGCSNSGTVIGNLSRAGGVVGENYEGTVEGCSNSGTVSGEDQLGGVVGFNNAGILEGCSNSGTVSGNFYVGGVVGRSGRNSSLTDCYNSGAVSGEEVVGGVIGMSSGDVLTNCYNNGSVGGQLVVGGLVGAGEKTTVANCYNSGAVSGGQNIGGVVGYIYDCTIENSYYLSDSETEDGGKTADQFASGEVAYLLSQGCTVGETVYSGEIWGQTIGTDAYPVLGGKTVYQGYTDCDDVMDYSNDPTISQEKTEHSWNDEGICDSCGAESHVHIPDDCGQTCKGYLCVDCGKWYGEANSNGHNSNNVGQETKKPTCDTPGEMTYTCDYCGGTYNEAINAYHNNNLEYHAAKDAIDCQNPGNIEYWRCPGCDEVFADAYATETLNPWYIDITVDCVRPEDAADCAVVPCEICGKDIYGYGEHDVLQCKGGTCSKCGAEIEGFGCANYTTPPCEDGVCYYCGGVVAGFGHENGAWKDCTDGECVYGCGLKYPATQDHVDEDGDEYCDECWIHINHVAPDDANLCEGYWCETCWSWVDGQHTGGEATCVSGPICTACGKEYGEKDPDAHKFVDSKCDYCGAPGEGVAAEINGTYYGSLDDALAAAEDNNVDGITVDTIKLLKDVTWSGMLSAVDLDLNGFVLSVDQHLVVFNDANILDSSASNSGLLLLEEAAKEYLVLPECNKQLPIYGNRMGAGEDKRVGYSFVEVEKFNTAFLEDGTFAFQPVLERSACDLLQAGADVSQVQVVVRVSWTNDSGDKRSQDFVYNDDLVRKFAASYSEAKSAYGLMFTLKLNVENLEDFGFQILVVSNRRVQIGTETLYK